MEKVFLSLLLILIVACHNTKQNPNKSQKENEKANNLNENSTNIQSNKDTGFFLRFVNDTLIQSMRVRYLNTRKISFAFTCINSVTHKNSSLAGIATMDEKKNDPEEDTADDGTAFLYDNWHYVQGKCQLYMRIADSAEYIRVFEFNCKSLHEKDCPFETLGVLKRVDIK